MTVIDVNSPFEAQQFNELIKHGNTIVFYYMDGCMHCEHMKPEWEKFERKVADMSMSNIDVARVNYRMLPLVNGPKDFVGFPSIYVLDGVMKKKEHNGERTEDAFSILLNELMNEQQVLVPSISQSKSVSKPKPSPKRKSKSKSRSKSKSKSTKKGKSKNKNARKTRKSKNGRRKKQRGGKSRRKR